MGTRKKSSGIVISRSLSDLKKAIKRKMSHRAVRSSDKKNVRALSDDEIFLNAMKEVQEIKEYREIPVRSKKNQKISQQAGSDLHNRKARINLEKIVKGQKRINIANTQEYVEWINSDYPDEIIEKLHAGLYSVQDSLDIHGLIVDEADIEVQQFIHESVRKRYHCVKIVTGRGRRSPKGPVLKNAVIQWLSRRYRKNVVAFVSARQCDGGLGALYVLLRL